MSYMDYEPEPRTRARATGPATSHAAARTVNFNDGHRYVLRALRVLKVATDERLYDYICEQVGRKISPSGCRTRRQELTAAGLITEGGTGRTESGRAAKKWRLTEKGAKAAERAYQEAHQLRLDVA